MLSRSPLITIVLGTRPEAIKLAPVIRIFKETKKIDVRLILTGQHKEMVLQVLDLFNIKADKDINIMQIGQSLNDITCRSLQGLFEEYQENRPDLLLVQGDTSTTFSAALAAFYQKIPVAHVEAGLRSNEIMNPYPEEVNRRLVSQIASIHFAPTVKAKQNLIKNGALGDIFVTGNTVIDSLLTIAKENSKLKINGICFNEKKFILATVHRRENWGEKLESISIGLKKIVDRFAGITLIIPMHPNLVVRATLQRILGNHPRIILVEPLDYKNLVAAIKECEFILTDSGGIQEEAPSLGKPVLVLRETTERPEAIEAGAAKLIGTGSIQIFEEASNLITNKELYESMSKKINPFGDGRASHRILEICLNKLGVE